MLGRLCSCRIGGEVPNSDIPKTGNHAILLRFILLGLRIFQSTKQEGHVPANFGWLRFSAAFLVMVASMCGAIPVRAADVVSEWSTIEMPRVPTLKTVTVDPKSTALFLLDFMHENCGQRPRCVAALPTIKAMHD